MRAAFCPKGRSTHHELGFLSVSSTRPIWFNRGRVLLVVGPWWWVKSFCATSAYANKLYRTLSKWYWMTWEAVEHIEQAFTDAPLAKINEFVYYFWADFSIVCCWLLNHQARKVQTNYSEFSVNDIGGLGKQWNSQSRLLMMLLKPRNEFPCPFLGRFDYGNPLLLFPHLSKC